jgi:plastocyanin
MRRPWVALAATLALAGCGGDDDRSARSVTVPAGGVLRASAKEYSYDPGRVTVEKAGPLRIILRNDGELAHDLRIRKGERDLGGTPAFQGGSRSATVRLAGGEYTFYCSVGDHEELGMKGDLRVR